VPRARPSFGKRAGIPSRAEEVNADGCVTVYLMDWLAPPTPARDCLEEGSAMRTLSAVPAAVVLVAIVTAAAVAQDRGATVTFTGGHLVVYEGTGETKMECPQTQPVTVGNLRIVDVIPPSESNFDNFGLVMPFRGALNERAVNLETRWGSRQGLALVCEAIDPTAPIGFRMRVHARRRMVHAHGVTLNLELARDPDRRHRIPAVRPSGRIFGDMHAWYVLTDLPTIHESGDPDDNEFAIILDVEGRGSFWLKWLEIKRWPTVLGAD